MGLRFLALQGLCKDLSILFDTYSLLTVSYSSSTWQISASTKARCRWHSSDPDYGSPVMTAAVTLLAATVRRMHTQRNLPFLPDLTQFSSSVKLVQDLKLEELFKTAFMTNWRKSLWRYFSNELEGFHIFLTLTASFEKEFQFKHCVHFFSFFEFNFPFFKLHCLQFLRQRGDEFHFNCISCYKCLS